MMPLFSAAKVRPGRDASECTAKELLASQKMSRAPISLTAARHTVQSRCRLRLSANNRVGNSMTDTPMASRLATLAARYWQFECEEFPLTALQAGEPSDTAILFRESSADYGRRYRKAGDLLAEVNHLVPADLAPQDRATQRLLRHELESIRSFHDVLAHHRPSLYPAGPDFATITFANSAAVPDAHTAERYLESDWPVCSAFIKDPRGELTPGIPPRHPLSQTRPRPCSDGGTDLPRRFGGTVSLVRPIQTFRQCPFARRTARGRSGACAHRARAASGP